MDGRPPISTEEALDTEVGAGAGAGAGINTECENALDQGAEAKKGVPNRAERTEAKTKTKTRTKTRAKTKTKTQTRRRSQNAAQAVIIVQAVAKGGIRKKEKRKMLSGETMAA